MKHAKFWQRHTATIFGVLAILWSAANAIAAVRVHAPQEPDEIKNAGKATKALWELTAPVGVRVPDPIEHAGEDLKAVWRLTADGQQAVSLGTIYVTGTLLTFFLALTLLIHRVEAIDKRVSELPSSHFTQVKPDEVLRELEHRIDTAKERIRLMYMRPDTRRGGKVEEYWNRTATAFLTKDSPTLKIRRIASIDDLKRLHFLLEQNAVLLADARVANIQYQLIALPDKRIKPQRIDIVDDTAFMCSADEPKFIVTNKDIVESCVDHYDELVGALHENYAILDTQNLRPLKGSPNGSYGYGDKQLENIARVIKFVLKTAPSEDTFKLIEKHCDKTWQQFQQLNESVEA